MKTCGKRLLNKVLETDPLVLGDVFLVASTILACSLNIPIATSCLLVTSVWFIRRDQND